MATTSPTGFPALLQDFFQRRLIAERGVNVNTLASYRDTFQLLLAYTTQTIGRCPSSLSVDRA